MKKKELLANKYLLGIMLSLGEKIIRLVVNSLFGITNSIISILITFFWSFYFGKKSAQINKIKLSNRNRWHVSLISIVTTLLLNSHLFIQNINNGVFIPLSDKIGVFGLILIFLTGAFLDIFIIQWGWKKGENASKVKLAK